MTTMRNRLTKSGAFLRGVMIGLAINVAIAEPLLAAPPGAIAGAESPRTAERPAITAEKLPLAVEQLFDDLKAESAGQDPSALDAECAGCGVAEMFAVQEALFGVVFQRSPHAHEVSFALDRSLVSNGFAGLSAPPDETATIVVLSAADTIDFESGTIPEAFPADLAALGARFASISWLTAAIQSDAGLVAVDGVEFAWRDEAGEIRCSFAPLAINNPDEPAITEPGGFGFRFRCALAATAFHVAAVACAACLVGCVLGVGCPCAALSCCAALILLPVFLTACRVGTSSEALVVLGGIASVSCLFITSSSTAP